MSVYSISFLQGNEVISKQEAVKPWKEISEIAWKIICIYACLDISTFCVSNSSLILFTGNPFAYTISLFCLTGFIYKTFKISLNIIEEAYSQSKDLYSFWKGHEVERS